MSEASPNEHPATEWVKKNASTITLIVAFFLFIFPHISPFEGLNHQLRFIQRFSEWMLGKVENLFDNYGYYVVFFGVLVENSMFLGLLVPGAIILILAGLAAENGSINMWYVIALAITATIIGDTVSYLIGRFGWNKLLAKSGMAHLVERVREPMESNSVWIILSYHLAGYSRVIGPAAAGIFRIPFRRWAPLDYAGGTIWVLLYSGIGVGLGLAGVEFGDTKRMVRLLEIVLLAIFALGVVVTFARQMRNKDRGGPPSGPTRHPATVIVPVDEQ